MSDDKFSNPVEARKKAMDYLARREHSRQELMNKLTGFGFDAEVASEAVVQLRADNLQSDSRFAESFIASRISQGKGPVRIRTELRERGLEDALIEDSLASAGQDWFALAASVRQKKFGESNPASFKEKARQMRFLQSRGFDSDQIQAAVSAHAE